MIYLRANSREALEKAIEAEDIAPVDVFFEQDIIQEGDVFKIAGQRWFPWRYLDTWTAIICTNEGFENHPLRCQGYSGTPQ